MAWKVLVRGDGKRKSIIKRICECLTCEYFEECDKTVENPQYNSDGSCKTKGMFRERRMNEKAI